MAEILLLEDDKVLAETLSDLLTLNNFNVTNAKDGQEALNSSFEYTFDLFLFDVNTPKIDGFELLESLRASGITTPAIFITSLADIDSLAKGFESGADDYIKKPFDFDELLIRIRALIAKAYQSTTQKISYGDLIFDLHSETLTQNGQNVKLTLSEKKILKIFLKNLGKLVLKAQIFELFDNLSDGSLRVHLSALRKIGFNIKSEKALGYRLETA